MALLPVRVKQPDEIRTLTFDFTHKKVPGTTLASPLVIAESGLTVVGAPTLADPLVMGQVSGGTLGVTYKVTCRVTASNGDVLELDVLIRVVEEN